MMLIQSRYDGNAPATEILVLDFAHRTRSRLRARLVSGEEVGLFLERGTILRGGQKLQAQDGRIVLVQAADEALLEVRCADSANLARAAYHLGNRHVAVQIGADQEGGQADWLRLQDDHVLRAMLEGLGARLAPLHGPFEPEAGAYAPGHQHPGQSQAARIHMMEPPEPT